MGKIKPKKEPDDANHPSLTTCDGIATTGSLDVKNSDSLLAYSINLIKTFIKLIEVSINFLEGNMKLILIDRGDGIRVCSFEKKDYCLETVEKEPKKKKNWKDHPNSDKLQAMIDDGLLEPYNTSEAKGLKLTKNFSKEKFSKYEASLGSMKAFAKLGEEGILFSVTGRPLTLNNLREYRDYHKS